MVYWLAPALWRYAKTLILDYHYRVEFGNTFIHALLFISLLTRSSNKEAATPFGYLLVLVT